MSVFHIMDITSKDVRASVDFYRIVGVDIPEEKIWEQNGEVHHVEARLTSDVGLGINSTKLTSSYDPNPYAACLIFQTDSRDDVDSLFGKLTGAGYAGHLAPIDAFWGSRYAIVDDPDGNHVGIMSPQDRRHQTAPNF